MRASSLKGWRQVICDGSAVIGSPRYSDHKLAYKEFDQEDFYLP